MRRNTIIALSAAGAVAAGCASMMMGEAQTSAKAIATMKTSFKEQGQAKLDRLDQDEVQRLCSEYNGDK